MKKMRRFTKRVVGFLLCMALVLANIPATALAVTYQGSNEAIGIRQTDFLKADGKLVRKNYGTGEVTYLRGTNAGGYLLQEFWMCLTDYTDNVRCDMEMYNKLTERFGKETMLELMDYYQDLYWTEQDFDNCAAMGMNCIRLPFWYRNLVDENGKLYSNAWERLDWFVREAGERGIYVILDMHGAPGSQNGRDHSGVDGDDNRQTEIARSEFFWGNNASRNQELYYSLWEQIARRYKDNPVVAGYDLLNEPYCAYRYESGKSDDELHNLLWGIYDKAYDKIRAIDPNHMIIMEATWDPWDLPNPAEYGWSNVMYEYHNYMYGDDNNEHGTQITGMQNKINNINAFDYYNVPSYMGEFNYFNQAGVWEEGLKLLNNSGLHWSTWTYKTTSYVGNWGIYHHTGDNRVNIETDSVDTIKSKWANVKTSSENTTMVNVLKKYLPGVNKTSQYVSLENGDYYLTVNGKVVKAQNGGNGPLAAVSGSYTGNAEKLTVVNNQDGTISLKSGANGKYVCADLNEDDNRLIARSDKIDGWEKFYAVRVSDTQIGLLAVANGRFIKGDFNDGKGNVLKAQNDSVAGAWEAFEVKKTNGEALDFGDKTGEDNVIENSGTNEAGNIISNPLFEDGTNNWVTYVQEGDAEVEFKKNAKAGLNVNISKPGARDWHVQLAQNNLHLEAGKQYKVSVDLISNASRTVRVALEKFVSDSDVTSYGEKNENLQAKTRTTISFTTDTLTESTDVGKLYIGLGNVSGSDAASKITICSVNVVPVEATSQEIKVTGITPSVTNIDLITGETQTIEAEVLPADATNKELSYSSNNTDVANVNSDGTITAVAAGSTTITIAAKDGSGVSATIRVNVTGESNVQVPGGDSGDDTNSGEGDIPDPNGKPGPGEGTVVEPDNGDDNNVGNDGDNDDTTGGNNGGMTGGDDTQDSEDENTSGGYDDETVGGDNTHNPGDESTTDGNNGGNGDEASGGSNDGVTGEDNDGTVGDNTQNPGDGSTTDGNNGGNGDEASGGSNDGVTGEDNDGTVGDNTSNSGDGNTSNGNNGGNGDKVTGGSNDETTGGAVDGTAGDNTQNSGDGNTSGGNNGGNDDEATGGTTGNNTQNPGDGSASGGNTGGVTEGNNAGSAGGVTGENNGGSTGGVTGGNNGGNTGGVTGGNNGGGTGGVTGENSTGNNTQNSGAGSTPGGNNIGTTGGNNTQISGNGNATGGMNNGNQNNGTVVNNTVTLNKGAYFIGGKYKYKITGTTAGEYTVELASPTMKNLKTVVVPSSVKYQGITFKVASIGKAAFRNNTKLKNVTIGKNVTSIGVNAFSGCKNLKSIKIKSLDIEKIGKNAFRSIYKKAVIKVPSDYLDDYKEMLKKAKVSSTVKVRK